VLKHLLWLRQRAFLESDGEAGANPEIVNGQDIGSAQAEDQQHFDGPSPHPLDLR